MKQICDGNLFLYAYSSFLWFIEIEIEYMYTWKVYFHIVLLFVVSQMHLCIKSIFMDILSGNWFIRTNEIYLLKNILSDHSCKLLLFMNQVFFLFIDHSFYKLFVNAFIQISCFSISIYFFLSDLYPWSTNLKSNINKNHII